MSVAPRLDPSEGFFWALTKVGRPSETELLRLAVLQFAWMLDHATRCLGEHPSHRSPTPVAERMTVYEEAEWGCAVCGERFPFEAVEAYIAHVMGHHTSV